MSELNDLTKRLEDSGVISGRQVDRHVDQWRAGGTGGLPASVEAGVDGPSVKAQLVKHETVRQHGPTTAPQRCPSRPCHPVGQPAPTTASRRCPVGARAAAI